MGNCLATKEPNGDTIPAPESKPHPSQLTPKEPATKMDDMPKLKGLALHITQTSSIASSDIANKPRQDSSFDRFGAPSSDDSRTPQEYTNSPMSSAQGSIRRNQLISNPNPTLTESALNELNQASIARKGQPSSTGGTTANTRPTELPDLPELSDVPESGEIPDQHSPRSDGVHFAATDMPGGTPPPVADGLPVVSLQDIAVMEQKEGRRGRRVKSRRGSTTASHASLSAIPENVEITPLLARVERSDSMRLAAHPVSRLADVQELDVRSSHCLYALLARPGARDVQFNRALCRLLHASFRCMSTLCRHVCSHVQIESKGNTAEGSRPSNTDSPHSSNSVLTSGDDSVMPHHVESHVEQQYEMLMPVLPRPSPYWRYPNATEAYRNSHPHRSPSLKGTVAGAGVAPASPIGPLLTSQHLPLVQHSTAMAFAAAPSCVGRPSSGGSFRAKVGVDRVLTDDSGLRLLSSVVNINDGKGQRVVSEDDLEVSAPWWACLLAAVLVLGFVLPCVVLCAQGLAGSDQQHSQLSHQRAAIANSCVYKHEQGWIFFFRTLACTPLLFDLSQSQALDARLRPPTMHTGERGAPGCGSIKLYVL
jgi:hypothetical protein